MIDLAHAGVFVDSAEPHDFPSSRITGLFVSAHEILIKSESAERQGHSTGRRKSNSDRKRNEKESGKVGTAGKGKRESEGPG
ncbi:hypothetical protein, partial [Streptomyces sp. NPDC006267]|uniref:hypothetical protein n=1 Tax=Streptomyces sp. NPDC006267 TaxID=3157173 RepID=UPI0033B7D5F7